QPLRNPVPSCRARPPGPPMTPMLRKIDRDVKRFRQIVRGVIKKEFRKYLTQGELIGRQGKHIVSIPLPQVEIPRFRFGQKEMGGVGQGEGEAGEAFEPQPGTEPGQPILEDCRYRSWHVREVPESNAVIILCMDVSGSMGDQQKEIVRIASFWIDTWLRSQYKNLDNVYVIHEAFAKEVDPHTFYHLRESGGTKISTAYELINQVVDTRFSPDSWNVYL